MRKLKRDLKRALADAIRKAQEDDLMMTRYVVEIPFIHVDMYTQKQQQETYSMRGRLDSPISYKSKWHEVVLRCNPIVFSEGFSNGWPKAMTPQEPPLKYPNPAPKDQS